MGNFRMVVRVKAAIAAEVASRIEGPGDMVDEEDAGEPTSQWIQSQGARFLRGR